MRVGIFSGRFDPPNLGHVLTLSHLLCEYHFLLVPILDYPEREGCSATDAKRIFDHHFDTVLPKCARNKIMFVINTEHFGKISPVEYMAITWAYDIPHVHDYLSGNESVLEHLKAMVAKGQLICSPVRVPRIPMPDISDQYLFESTRIRKKMKDTGKTLDDIYHLDR
jgi:hypothetical protein